MVLLCLRFLYAVSRTRSASKKARVLPHRCLLYARNPYVVCTANPDGVDGDRCLDFRLDPNIKPEEKWSPKGYSWYGDELVRARA